MDTQKEMILQSQSFLSGKPKSSSLFPRAPNGENMVLNSRFPTFLRNRPWARWKHVVDDISLQPAIQPILKVRNGLQSAEQHPVELNRANSTDIHYRINPLET